MKPEIVCYMMMSLDGRIDCAMTAQMRGNDAYYATLADLDLPTTLSGRRTAASEMAGGTFTPKDATPYGKDGFHVAAKAPGYEVVVDSRGTLLWPKETSTTKLHLIITSRRVSAEYLRYLDGQNISWIVAGEEHTDLKKAMDVLGREFGVRRMGVVGGPTINTAFLNAGLLDEIDIMVGPGIDGRASMPSVFEGRKSATPLPLTFKGVRTFPSSGAVLLRYSL